MKKLFLKIVFKLYSLFFISLTMFRAIEKIVDTYKCKRVNELTLKRSIGQARGVNLTKLFCHKIAQAFLH